MIVLCKCAAKCCRPASAAASRSSGAVCPCVLLYSCAAAGQVSRASKTKPSDSAAGCHRATAAASTPAPHPRRGAAGSACSISARGHGADWTVSCTNHTRCNTGGRSATASAFGRVRVSHIWCLAGASWRIKKLAMLGKADGPSGPTVFPTWHCTLSSMLHRRNNQAWEETQTSTNLTHAELACAIQILTAVRCIQVSMLLRCDGRCNLERQHTAPPALLQNSHHARRPGRLTPQPSTIMRTRLLSRQQRHAHPLAAVQLASHNHTRKPPTNINSAHLFSRQQRHAGSLHLLGCLQGRLQLLQQRGPQLLENLGQLCGGVLAREHAEGHQQAAQGRVESGRGTDHFGAAGRESRRADRQACRVALGFSGVDSLLRCRKACIQGNDLPCHVDTATQSWSCSAATAHLWLALVEPKVGGRRGRR